MFIPGIDFAAINSAMKFAAAIPVLLLVAVVLRIALWAIFAPRMSHAFAPLFANFAFWSFAGCLCVMAMAQPEFGAWVIDTASVPVMGMVGGDQAVAAVGASPSPAPVVKELAGFSDADLGLTDPQYWIGELEGTLNNLFPF